MDCYWQHLARQAWERITRAMLKEVKARPILWTRRILWAQLEDAQSDLVDVQRLLRLFEAQCQLAQGQLRLQ